MKALSKKEEEKKTLMSVEVSNKALKTIHLRENILPFEMDSAVVC